MNQNTKGSKSEGRIKQTLLILAMAGGIGLTQAEAQQKYEMPAKAKFDPNPAAANSETRKFMTYGSDRDGKKIPTKTVRITNNSGKTVYPIMRSPNTNVMKDKVTGLYDPYDPPKREYRGYIGYEEGGKYYFGLKDGESILVSIPLVFWNAARMGIETGGKYLNADQDNKPNPLNNDALAQRTIAAAEKSSDTITNGVVMWYRSELNLAPADDTEDQLVEWTIRDHKYLKDTSAKFGNEIPDNQLVTLINYDVSNVDSLYMPVAMEALDAWVVPQKTTGTGDNPNRAGWEPGSLPEAYGWTGAIMEATKLQAAIREFTAGDPQNPNALLKQYFGGHGWPYYNFPGVKDDKTIPMKIPSGANIFPQSPILDVRSSYNTGKSWEEDKYMLSSGGDTPVSTTIGWAGGTPDPKGSTVLHLLKDAEAQKKLAFVKEGYLVEGRPPEKPPLPNPIAKGTTVKKVDVAAGTVTLSQPLLQSSEASAFKFDRPVDDYAASAMIRLWYSWAQYYLNNWKSQNALAPTAPKKIKGSMDLGTSTITFNEKHPELVLGMSVQGLGLDEAKTEVGKHQGNAVILEIASDQKSVIVSQVSFTATTNQDFTFSPPQPLLYTPSKKGDPGYPLITNFNFPADQAEPGRDPYAFSQKVYLIMASMNQIGQKNNNNVSKFMQDIIGANMGFIFQDDMKLKDDAKMVTAMIRDMVKSVLRGVSDFTEFPDKLSQDGKTHLVWYPDPKKPTGGQKFNVFNLDPFVWFVHVQLGFSGYGFSVDDDTADVGAGGATQLQVTVAGTEGLPNKNVWSIQAPFGPLKNVSAKYSGPDVGDTLYNAITMVSATSDNHIKITTDGQNNLKQDELVVIDQVVGVPNALGEFKVGHPTTNSFELLDAKSGAPIPFSGTYDPKVTRGRWSYPKRPYIDTGSDLTKVFFRVSGDDAMGTFEGTFVSINGVTANKKGEKFRVWRLGKQDTGRLILNTKLTNADGSDLQAGTYNFNFFGDSSGQPTK